MFLGRGTSGIPLWACRPWMSGTPDGWRDYSSNRTRNHFTSKSFKASAATKFIWLIPKNQCNTIARTNDASVHLCKPWTWNFTNAGLMIWHRTTWLESRKHHILSYKNLVLLPQTRLEKCSGFILTNVRTQSWTVVSGSAAFSPRSPAPPDMTGGSSTRIINVMRRVL